MAGAEQNSERLNEAKYVSVAQPILDLNFLKCGVENSGENVMPKWVHVKVTPDWPPIISFSNLKICLNMLYYVLIIVSIEKARWRNTVYCYYCKSFTKIENLFWINVSIHTCNPISSKFLLFKCFNKVGRIQNENDQFWTFSLQLTGTTPFREKGKTPQKEIFQISVSRNHNWQRG